MLSRNNVHTFEARIHGDVTQQVRSRLWTCSSFCSRPATTPQWPLLFQTIKCFCEGPRTAMIDRPHRTDRIVVSVNCLVATVKTDHEKSRSATRSTNSRQNEVCCALHSVVGVRLDSQTPRRKGKGGEMGRTVGESEVNSSPNSF